MFSVTHRSVVYRFSSVVMLLLLVLPGLTPLSLPGRSASADPNIPRSYAEFINGAYMGALGRLATCAERQAEYDRLANAASSGTLLQEARRFVSTLFETQASFDVPDYATYCQTPEYEAINPAFCNNLVGTGLAGFLTDQYQAFLLREPDPGGFDFWLHNNDGRKHLIIAFESCIEFGILVSNLFPGARPTCPQPNCQVLVDPDPMILVSFRPFFFASDSMRAFTAPPPCIFIADFSLTLSPISAVPLTPLGLPFDIWSVFDNGDPIPFGGFAAVGTIGFLAYNGDDATLKEGTILLTVFDFFTFGPVLNQGALIGVPVTGEYTTTTTPARADRTIHTATRHFFRDRQGRMRLEGEDVITIYDPVAGVRYILNTKEKTAYRVMIKNESSEGHTAAPGEPPADRGLNKSPLSEGRSLGRQRVGGVEAAGQEYTSVIPAGSKLGNRDPLPVTYQVWRSEGLQLPLSVRIQDALNGETSIQFKLLQKGTDPDQKLFAVPEGYRVVDAKPGRQMRRGQLF